MQDGSAFFHSVWKFHPPPEKKIASEDRSRSIPPQHRWQGYIDSEIEDGGGRSGRDRRMPEVDRHEERCKNRHWQDPVFSTSSHCGSGRRSAEPGTVRHDHHDFCGRIPASKKDLLKVQTGENLFPKGWRRSSLPFQLLVRRSPHFSGSCVPIGDVPEDPVIFLRMRSHRNPDPAEACMPAARLPQEEDREMEGMIHWQEQRPNSEVQESVHTDPSPEFPADGALQRSVPRSHSKDGCRHLLRFAPRDRVAVPRRIMAAAVFPDDPSPSPGKNAAHASSRNPPRSGLRRSSDSFPRSPWKGSRAGSPLYAQKPDPDGLREDFRKAAGRQWRYSRKNMCLSVIPTWCGGSPPPPAEMPADPLQKISGRCGWSMPFVFPMAGRVRHRNRSSAQETSAPAHEVLRHRAAVFSATADPMWRT